MSCFEIRAHIFCYITNILMFKNSQKFKPQNIYTGKTNISYTNIKKCNPNLSPKNKISNNTLKKVTDICQIKIP